MNPLGEIAIIGILCLYFLGLGILGGKYETNKANCQQKGGLYLQGSDGWLCIKGEKL